MWTQLPSIKTEQADSASRLTREKVKSTSVVIFPTAKVESGITLNNGVKRFTIPIKMVSRNVRLQIAHCFGQPDWKRKPSHSPECPQSTTVPPPEVQQVTDARFRAHVVSIWPITIQKICIRLFSSNRTRLTMREWLHLTSLPNLRTGQVGRRKCKVAGFLFTTYSRRRYRRTKDNAFPVIQYTLHRVGTL